jgi:hypothetical protein
MNSPNHTSVVDAATIHAGELELSQELTLNANAHLRFAKEVLLGLALLCGGVIGGYALAPDNQALRASFELVKIGALPLVTLVVSFYFPNSSK